MAVRTLAASVQAILLDHYDGSSNLTAFIDSASSLVDRVAALDSDSILGSSNLELIERWLAAHFYAHADQLMQTKSTGRAGATFQGKTAMMLNSTQYGQTAMVMDFTGELRKMNAGNVTVGINWLGTKYKNDQSELAGDQ